jgi:fused signal recognition particle receptor
MRRWFPRKGKHKDRDEELEEVLLEETAPESSEPVPWPEDAAAAGPAPEPSAPEVTPEVAEGEAELAAAETAAAEGETAATPQRCGFFRRWRREPEAPAADLTPETAPPPFDFTPEIPAEPLTTPGVEIAPVIPVAPELEPAPPEAEPAAAPEAEAEEAAAAIPAAEDLELPGEVAEEVRRKRFQRLRNRLRRTREAFSGRLDRLFRGRKVIDAEFLEELEELLITADLGVDTSLLLIEALQEKLRRRELADVEKLKAALQAEMVALLTAPPPPEISTHPWVVLLVGVNGVGKTTTLAKLAHRDRHLGLSSLLVAGDTFRAAAVEQLEIWGERVGAAVIKQKPGADPAAVVFDGLAAAEARGAHTVYIDTAGRLHTKVNLMEELKKIRRTAAKKIPGAPHEVLLVLDATTGQNALNQARLFHEAVGVTGLILTKMDGTAKGGVALAVVHETGIPLRYIGVGEAMADLRPFDAEAFVEAILG